MKYDPTMGDSDLPPPPRPSDPSLFERAYSNIEKSHLKNLIFDGKLLKN